MILAFFKAVTQLGDPRLMRLIGLTVLISIGVFLALFLGIGFLLAHTRIFDAVWLDTAVDVLGGMATVLLSWFLFPGVLSAVLGLFLEPVANAVEARHYPELGPAKGLGFVAGIVEALRFLVVTVVLNVLLLVFLFFPPVFPFVFYLANGYLIGREYLELVALRRCNTKTVREMRRAHRGVLWLFGVAIAFLLTVPVANFIAPVLATAAMVHLVVPWLATRET